MNLQFGAGPICRGFDQAEDFAIELVPATVTATAAGTPGTLRDADTLALSGATVDTVFSVQFSDTPTDSTTITNLTPGVATFSGSAVASFVADGLAQVQASNPTLGTRLVTAPVGRSMSAVTKFASYIAGALSLSMSSLVDGATGGGAAPSTVARFSSLATNTRNSALWCSGIVDDTGITRELDTFALNALIGPRHVLYAAHVGCAGQLGFVGSDATGYVATVVSTGAIAGADLAVAYLRDATTAEIAAYNAAHPGSKAATEPLSVGIAAPVIKPLAILPAAVWSTPGPAALALSPAVAVLANYAPVPVFHTTKANAIGIWEIAEAPQSVLYTTGTTYPNELEIAQPIVAARAPFSLYANVGGSASGDLTLTAIPAGSAMASANPSLGAGYPILLGATHGSPGGSTFFLPWVALYGSQIQALMQSLAQAAGDPAYATYAPIVISLSGYSTY
jgi:hypothetical protein